MTNELLLGQEQLYEIDLAAPLNNAYHSGVEYLCIISKKGFGGFPENIHLNQCYIIALSSQVSVGIPTGLCIKPQLD